MNMNEDILEGQIRLLATQVIECKKEINLMRKENEKYFYLIQSLMELLNKEDSGNMEVDDETARTIQSFTKVKDEIKYLKYQTEQIQNNIQSIHDGFIDTSNLNSEDIIKLKQIISETYRLISSNENGDTLSLEQ